MIRGGRAGFWKYLRVGLTFLRQCRNIILIIMNSQFEKPSPKLLFLLQEFKRFPEESRKPIYISSLQLPKNYKHLTTICQPPMPLVEHTIDRDTCTLVATIIKLNPSLNIQWTPGIVYPFAKLFKKDLLAQFQIALTFLYNWASNWFRDYPTPPRDLMDFMTEQLPQLHNKIICFGHQFSSFVWPMFLVLFTDVLNKDDWLQLFDYVFIHPNSPQILVCCVVALLKSLQKHLMKGNSVQDMHRILRKQRQIDMATIIKNAVELAKRQKQTLKQLHQDRVFPLPSDFYPISSFTEKSYIVSQSECPLTKTCIEQINNIQQVMAKFENQSKWEGTENQIQAKQFQKGGLKPKSILKK